MIEPDHDQAVDERGQGRRAFLQKSLVAAGAAWTAPIVSTLGDPVAAATGSVCPFTWCFDGGTTEGWTIDNTAGNGNGLWHVSNTRSFSSSYALAYSDPTTGDYDTGGTNAGTVTSPSFTVPAGGGNLTLRVWREVETFGSGTWDEFTVSIAGGATLYAVSRDGGTGNNWDLISLSLNAYASTSIQIVLGFDTKDGAFNGFEGVWVDDVTIPCTTPPSLSALSASRSLRAGPAEGFFPDRPAPTAREIRQRRRAVRDQWSGTVTDG